MKKWCQEPFRGTWRFGLIAFILIENLANRWYAIIGLGVDASLA